MNAILVDDEIRIITILKETIEWTSLGISKLFFAYNSVQAKKIIENNKIDIIICDIEMPQESGLTLLKWIQKEKPQIVRIILTGFPDFDYAREAVSIGVFKYLLKPVRFDELKSVITDAIAVAKRNQTETEQQECGVYYQEHKQDTIRTFYRDLLSGDILPDQNAINKDMENRMLDIKKMQFNYIILLHAEHIDSRKSYAECTEVYAYRNIAEEMFPFLVDVSTQNDIIWIVRTYECNYSVEVIVQKFEDTIFKVAGRKLDAYIAECVSMDQARKQYLNLQLVASKYKIPGRRNYYIADWFSSTEQICDTETIVASVKKFLKEHYNQEITRAMLEEQYHLNQDYLNRIFKNATGQTLMEYVQSVRIQRAKQYLDDSFVSISEVGFLVGYSVPSYFTKVFKKITGYAPHEYRNRRNKV